MIFVRCRGMLTIVSGAFFKSAPPTELWSLAESFNLESTYPMIVAVADIEPVVC